MQKCNVVVLLCCLSFSIIGCGKDIDDIEIVEDTEIVATNTKPEQVEYEEDELWVNCPTKSTKVGTLYTFIDGNIKYMTDSQKYGPALYEGLKYPNITAQIRVQPRTVVNPTEYDILDVHFYDNGEDLRSIKTIDELWVYYKETYAISKPGEKFSGDFQLSGIKQEKTLNGEVYLALTFTGEDFTTIVCRDYNKQDMLTLNENYYGRWYSIVYRVDEGLHYSENKTDTYYTVVSMKAL